MARFGTTLRRLTLLAGLKEALDMLRAAGCRRAYVDGSFVTSKPEPADVDGCWETDGVDPAHLDPVLLTFDRHRRDQKARFGGELFFPTPRRIRRGRPSWSSSSAIARGSPRASSHSTWLIREYYRDCE